MLGIKYFLIALLIIIAFLAANKIVTYEKPAYGCYPDTTKKYRLGEPVRILTLGNFNIYARPYVKDCPEENRYDPERVDETCGNYCSRYNF